jgi:outer membrane receptor protein involved in Fe transport
MKFMSSLCEKYLSRGAIETRPAALALTAKKIEGDEIMKTIVPVLVGVSLALACAEGRAQEAAKDVLKVSIERKSLRDALNEWAQQTGNQLIAEIKGEFVAPKIEGKLTAQEALERLLEGTPLTYQWMGERLVAVKEKGMVLPAALQSTSADGKEQAPIRVARLSGNELGRIRLAASEQSIRQEERSQSSQSIDPGSRKGGVPIETVLVTAQKRTERLQDVPVPVTAIDSTSLANSNQVRLRDYFTRVPGLNLTEAGIYGGSVISFRGITSGILNGGTATVVVDEVPYGVSSNPGGPTSVVPEIDPNDLVRLEALRGPQGTLYGASSMGGLLKYVTADPSTDARTGYLRGGFNGVRNGDGGGYNVSVGINLPLSGTWALRASAFTRQDPGYIDNPVHSIDGVNSEQVSGGRISALWQLSPDFSVKLGALYQESDADGNNYVSPTFGGAPLGEWQQVTAPGSGGYQKVLEVYTANVAAQFGNADLASISAYSRNRATYQFDLSSLAFYSNNAQTQFGVTGAKAVSEGTTERFTQELRVTLPLGERTEWLFGGFYANERNPRINRYLALDFTTGAEAGLLGTLDFPGDYEETSVFTDLTYHFTDRFDVQVGGRFADMTVSLPHNSSTGIFGSVSQGEVESKDESFTYLLTPRFRLSDDLMVYARFASGYRPGGPNLANTQLDPSIPQAFTPDETINYEIGAKGNVLGRLLTFDASIYYIEWNDIQLQSLFSSTARVNYKANGGDGKSQGIDLALESRPLTGMKITGAGAWNLAELTESFPAESTLAGARGDRLPFSARFTGSISIDQEFPLGAMQGFVGVTESYIGDRKGPFLGAGATRADLPDYFTTDLRAGVKRDNWEANLYVNNLTDERGLLMGGAGSFLANIYTYIRPRAVGVSLVSKF